MNPIISDEYCAVSRLVETSEKLAKQKHLRKGRTTNGVIATMKALNITPVSFGERCIAIRKADVAKILVKWKAVDDGKRVNPHSSNG